jgi:hypothetical protein
VVYAIPRNWLHSLKAGCKFSFALLQLHWPILNGTKLTTETINNDQQFFLPWQHPQGCSSLVHKQAMYPSPKQTHKNWVDLNCSSIYTTFKVRNKTNNQQSLRKSSSLTNVFHANQKHIILTQISAKEVRIFQGLFFI